MKHLPVALLLVLPIQASDPDIREFYLGIVAVEKHWDGFIRAAFDCQPHVETTSETCQGVQSGHIDYAEFKLWWKAAKKLHGE